MARYKKGSAKLIAITCPDCGKTRQVHPYHYKYEGFSRRCLHCHCLLMNAQKKGKLGANWKGGRNPTGDGAIRRYIFKDNPFFPMINREEAVGGYVLEHRLIIAEYLGRCLKPQEIVHHLNGIRDDNRIENLILVNAQNHEKRTLVKALQRRIKELEEDDKERLA